MITTIKQNEKKLLTYSALSTYRKCPMRYNLSADQGNGDAQFSVGICHYFGLGVPENEEEAKRWFQRAAEGGCEEAAEFLEEHFQ